MVVHPDSSRITRVRPYSGTNPTEYIVFTDGAITLYGGPFQGPLVNNAHDCQSHQRLGNMSYNTHLETVGTYHAKQV